MDFLGWPIDQVREVFGETVLIRHALNGHEFGRPDPAPDSDEVRDEVTSILTRARLEPPRQITFNGPGLADVINAIDWRRINGALTYALLHGGNLPRGFMPDRSGDAR